MRKLLLLLAVMLMFTGACSEQSSADPAPSPPTVPAPGQPDEPPAEPPADQPDEPDETPDDDPDETPAPTGLRIISAHRFSYTPDDSSFPNPERGFHQDYDLSSFGPVRTNPTVTLVRSYIRLDHWRYAPLPAGLLVDLQRGFDQVREAGVKVIPRFSYNFGREPDAPLESVLLHIEQLTPLLQHNADVIAVLQAGFVGYWGEWHNSTHGLDTARNKQRIAHALLDALPQERMVQIRAPFHMWHILGSEEPFSPDDAFSGSDQARLGLKNDCFLSGTNDVGTFPDQQAYEYTWALAPYTVIGGETCEHPPAQGRQECPNALDELLQFHWDYLNLEYFAPVLDKWWAGGCFAEIERRLGYRFSVDQARLTDSGAGFDLELTFSNSGFGKLYNPRPLELVFVERSGAHEPVTVELAADARLVMPLAGGTVTRTFTIATDLPAGVWGLELWLPDAAPHLRERPAYSIRLASLDEEGATLWRAATGRNVLGFLLEVPAA